MVFIPSLPMPCLADSFAQSSSTFYLIGLLQLMQQITNSNIILIIINFLIIIIIIINYILSLISSSSSSSTLSSSTSTPSLSTSTPSSSTSTPSLSTTSSSAFSLFSFYYYLNNINKEIIIKLTISFCSMRSLLYRRVLSDTRSRLGSPSTGG